MTQIMEELNAQRELADERKRSFGIVLRGRPDDFAWLVDQAKAAGLYVVFTKTSHLKIVLKEVPF